MTTQITNPLTFHVQWAKDALALAHRAFAENPSATRWDCLQRAAFTYQQIDWASHTNTIDREKLAFDIDSEWQKVICRATLGVGVRTTLRDSVTV